MDEDFKKTRSDKARRDRLEARNRLKRKAELVSSVSIVSIHLKILPTKINLCQHYFQDTDDDDEDLPEVPWLERQVSHLECGIIVLFCVLREITKLNE